MKPTFPPDPHAALKEDWEKVGRKLLEAVVGEDLASHPEVRELLDKISEAAVEQSWDGELGEKAIRQDADRRHRLDPNGAN